MATLSHQLSYQAVSRPSVFTKYRAWAESEEKINHVSWVGISVTIMSAVLAPMAMTLVLMNGAVFGLIIPVMAALVLVVAANLAAMPVKYTIPLLLLGALADIGAVILSFFIR